MTWPASAVVTTNTDADTDSPLVARPNLLDLIQKFNQVQAHASSVGQALLAATDAIAARSTIGAAPLSGPVFTDSPAGPTASPGTNTTQLATTAFVVAADALTVHLSGTETITGAKTLQNAIITGGSISGVSSIASSGTVTGSNLSGTNTGNQTITLTGDVTGSGTGSFAASIASASISQGKLKTTYGDVSVTDAAGNFTMPGGFFGFYPNTRSRDYETGNRGIDSRLMLYDASGVGDTGFLCNIYLDALYGSGTNKSIASARQYYIQASPPYDLGDGEIPLFVFALLDYSGNILATYVAPEAPWHYNGPTDIRATFYNDQGKAFRSECEFKKEHGSVQNALEEGFTIDQIAIQISDSTFVDVEITQAIKNADMDLIPHPFIGNDLTGKTVILLDPVSPMIEKLSILHESGESITDLLHDKSITISNDDLKRYTPKGVIACSANWKLSK